MTGCRTPRPAGERQRVDFAGPLRRGVAADGLGEVGGRASRSQPVLVVDFGAQYAQLIARRVREAHVYSEIVPNKLPLGDLIARRPAAIILSGGPASVYAPGAPRLDPALLSAGVPVLGICYGFQAMAQALGGVVARTDAGEDGRTPVEIAAESKLLGG